MCFFSGLITQLGKILQLLTAIDNKIVVAKVAEEPKVMAVKIVAAKVAEEPKVQSK